MVHIDKPPAGLVNGLLLAAELPQVELARLVGMSKEGLNMDWKVAHCVNGVGWHARDGQNCCFYTGLHCSPSMLHNTVSAVEECIIHTAGQYQMLL